MPARGYGIFRISEEIAGNLKGVFKFKEQCAGVIDETPLREF